MISTEEVVGLYMSRKKMRAPMYTTMQRVKDLYNTDLAVPLPELDSNEQAAVTNLLKQGIDGTAQRIASTLPDVYFPAVKPGQKTSEETAQTARRAVLGMWGLNNMTQILSKRARHYLGYATSPVILRPDRKDRIARWEVRDPLSYYPAPSVLDTMTPPNAIFTYTRGVDWLKRSYPECGVHLNGRDQTVTLLEYLDDEVTVLIALGQDRDPMSSFYDSPGAQYGELLRSPNLTGCCPVVGPTRVTLDRPAGQFDGLIPMYYKQAKLDALEYIAIEQGIFPRTWLVARQGEVPQIVEQADGRKGVIGVVKGGVIQEENLNPGYKTTQAIDRLAGEQRMEGNVPAEMQGVSGQNIRTGRRGDEVLSNGIDFGIQESQRAFEISLREENKIAVAITKTYFGSEPHSFYVNWRGASGQVDFIPDKIFVSDHNVVKYALAGSDLNGQVIRAGQKLGANLISLKTARQYDPEIEDPEFEESQIVVEMAKNAFMQGVANQMMQGTIPLPDAAKFVDLLQKKMSPIEALLKVQEDAQARQATSGPPGTPEAPVEPTAPEAQPGIAPGAEAGVAIPMPGTAAQRVQEILRQSGTARQAIQSGKQAI